jgi:hypothetical protein
MSASCREQNGPETACSKATTRVPVKGCEAIESEFLTTDAFLTDMVALIAGKRIEP